MHLNEQSQSNNDGLVSAQTSRLKALKDKHAALSKRIDKERQHSFYSDTVVARLKKEKLLLKEEIEGIRQAS